MASFKAIAVLSVLAVLAISVSSTPVANSFVSANFGQQLAKNNSHHLVVGSHVYGDKLIYSENIAESYLISGQKRIVERSIKAPANHYITLVNCLDQITDGTGAEAVVTGGGPGADYVNLRFKSQRWHGVYFQVEIYAKSKF